MKAKNNNLRRTLAALGAVGVVVAGTVFGTGCERKENAQQKKAFDVMSHQVFRNTQSYVFSPELFALQRIVNRSLPQESQVKEDGMLPNSELQDGHRVSKVSEVAWAMGKMPVEKLDEIQRGLSGTPFNILDIELLTKVQDSRINPVDVFQNVFDRRVAALGGNDEAARKELQRALNKCGYELNVDGIHGTQTTTAFIRQLSTLDGRTALINAYRGEVKANMNAKQVHMQRVGRE